jgi:hypothetical protein
MMMMVAVMAEALHLFPNYMQTAPLSNPTLFQHKMSLKEDFDSNTR